MDQYSFDVRRRRGTRVKHGVVALMELGAPVSVMQIRDNVRGVQQHDQMLRKIEPARHTTTGEDSTPTAANVSAIWSATFLVINAPFRPAVSTGLEPRLWVATVAFVGKKRLRALGVLSSEIRSPTDSGAWRMGWDDQCRPSRYPPPRAFINPACASNCLATISARARCSASSSAWALSTLKWSTRPPR
jgi:hypothetical protein